MIAYVRVVVLRFMRYVSEVHLNADQRRPQKLKLREQQYLLLVENKPVRSWSSRANWFRLSKERSSQLTVSSTHRLLPAPLPLVRLSLTFYLNKGPPSLLNEIASDDRNNFKYQSMATDFWSSSHLCERFILAVVVKRH